MKENQLTLRLDDELFEKLQRAADKKRNPFAPTMTAIAEHGIKLALKELEKQK